jgi:MFS family permease
LFRPQTFSSLRHADFRYLWAGTFFMSAGQWIQQVTLGWLMYELTRSPVMLGMMNGLRMLPFLVSSPLAGVAADRMDRRKLMLSTQWLLVVTAFLVGALAASGLLQVWHLFAVTLITGIAWSFNEPVRQSVVPNIVPRDDLMNAVALNSMAFNTNKVLGPALGGMFIAAFGAAGNFFVQGLAYGAVLVTIFWMSFPRNPVEARRTSALANLKEGLAYVWSTPTILALLIADLVPRIFAVPYQTLMPVFQKDVLHVGPEGLGFLMAAPAVGAILGLFTLASLSNLFRQRGLLLLSAIASMGWFLVVFSWISSFPLALIVLVAVGYCQSLCIITTNTLIQVMVPDALRGRVMGLYMLDRGLMPAGSLLAGATAQFIGAPATVEIMGFLVILLALAIGFGMPIIRKIET